MNAHLIVEYMKAKQLMVLKELGKFVSVTLGKG